MPIDLDALERLEREATPGCKCDFCSGRKRWDDNWCPRCGEVQLHSPKWWENLDVCEQCEKATAVDAMREGR